MKRGLIVTNAYSTLKSARYQVDRLKEEFSSLGVEITAATSDRILPCINANGISGTVGILLGMHKTHGFISADGYDFCVYLDKDKYAPRLLEKSGLRLFNSAKAIETCDDKMLTHIALADIGLPMPTTVPGLLCYSPETPLKTGYIDGVEARLGYPVIVKECYGSLGKGVYKADNREELNTLAEKLKCVPHLFQKCLNRSIGRDLRVIAIGGKPIAAMERISDTDFRSNIELGGRGRAYETDNEIAGICEGVCSVLGLDFCGIDLLFQAPMADYSLCEVNSNAFFGGIEKATGVNVAKLYAEYICKEIYK